MPVSVTMPRLGESVTEGTVTRWLKQEGEHVDADEPLLEVSTDKVDTEVPSPASGTLLSPSAVSPNAMRNSASVISAPPIQSSRRPSAGASTGTRSQSSASATKPNGRLMAKTSRQLHSPKAVSTNPPTTGPRMVVSEEAEAQMPMAQPRWSRG